MYNAFVPWDRRATAYTGTDRGNERHKVVVDSRPRGPRQISNLIHIQYYRAYKQVHYVPPQITCTNTETNCPNMYQCISITSQVRFYDS